MLVKLILLSGSFWERENGFMRLVRRDYNNIFKKERVNLGGFKFNLLIANFYLFAEMVIN